jgi:polyhydroxybutyrate depolymerase
MAALINRAHQSERSVKLRRRRVSTLALLTLLAACAPASASTSSAPSAAPSSVGAPAPESTATTSFAPEVTAAPAVTVPFVGPTTTVAPPVLDEAQTVETQAGTRNWTIVRRAGDTLVPLVIVLHGVGGRGVGMRHFGFDSFVARGRAMVAYPDSLDGGWKDGRIGVDLPVVQDRNDDVAFMRTIIDRAIAEGADPARVYIAGFSNGAIMTGRLGCDLADRLAGVALVSGTLPAGFAAKCAPARPIPALVVFGTADAVVPYAGGAVAHNNGHARGSVEAVSTFLGVWSRTNGCTGSSTSVVSAADPRVERIVSTGCRAGSVTHDRVIDGLHAWNDTPTYRTTTAIATFFDLG